MNKRNIILVCLLVAAGIQTALAQGIKVWQNGKSVYYSLSAVDSLTFDESTFFKEREWVDLGLPSGTLWATCNVGADAPEEYGDYFAWGETKAKEDYSSWSTYFDREDGSSTFKIYKDDGLTELLPEHDAATANWGSEWQMPSLDQIKELYNSEYTTVEWTVQNGVSGRLVKSKSNSNSIFLPAAGLYDVSGLDDTDSRGYYWSRSLYTSDSYYSYYLYVASNKFSWYANPRYFGQSVRPVRVPILVTDITLSQSSLRLYVDDSQTLTATVLPENAANKNVVWESSDNSIASVDQVGKVTANAKGSCIITCSAKDGSGVKGECQVTVNSNEQTFTVEGVSFKMKRVAGGTFTMGATSEQYNGYMPEENESPTHLVTLSDYWIGETEVTQALWYAVTGEKPYSGKNAWSTTSGLGDNYPAYHVYWVHCRNFIATLNELTGKTFRFPTEAEWEFAARGGNKSKGYIFSGSNTIDDVAWYWGNIPSASLQPVATKAPNELGIYDMSGNVHEWVLDGYSDYSSDSQTNPTGPSSGSNHILRGGCCFSQSASDCRVSYRIYAGQIVYDGLGLRLAQ